ncbi:MAG TPA: hypothetical protein PLN21_14725 [Gemmatales bacterium]|nr:hypothetical protein [Gemmatales bacterium]
MPTKPKKKKKTTKVNVPFPMPRKSPLPPGLKGARIEDVMAKARELWDPTDPELDKFLELVRNRKRD